jgi:hypothetical protein
LIDHPVLLLTSLDATVRLDAHADHRESPPY